MSHANSIQSDVINEQIHMSPSAIRSTYNAQKVCPNCQHVSPYILNENILKCPKCNYQSNLVEHAQQY